MIITFIMPVLVHTVLKVYLFDKEYFYCELAEVESMKLQNSYYYVKDDKACFDLAYERSSGFRKEIGKAVE